jgi:hypothetical protein
VGNNILDAPEMPWLGGSKVVSLWFVKTYVASRLLSIAGRITGLFLIAHKLPLEDDAPLPAETKAIIKEELRAISEELNVIGLRISKRFAERISSDVDSAKVGDIDRFTDVLEEALLIECDELSFIYVSSGKLKTYDRKDLFGSAVLALFPDAEFDIKEAGNCLALERNTACVFHCMRILEHGLYRLAKKFKVPFNHKTWSDVILPIEKAIRAISSNPKKKRGWKSDEQFYSQVALQIMFFKNAWRNYTAHVQFNYGETEAERIFEHVRDFMQYLASKPRKL